MQYRRFLFYNILGGTAWTLCVILPGYYLGAFSIVKDNMGLLIIGVLVVTAATVAVIAAGILSAYFPEGTCSSGKKPVTFVSACRNHQEIFEQALSPPSNMCFIIC